MSRPSRRIYGRVATPFSDKSGVEGSYDPTKVNWDAFELQYKTKIPESCCSAILAAFMAGALLVESEQSLLRAPDIEKLLRKISRRPHVEELIAEKAADPTFEVLISLLDITMGQPGAFVDAVLADRRSEIELGSNAVKKKLSKITPIAPGMAWRATICAVAEVIENFPDCGFRPSARCDGRGHTVFVALVDWLQRELLPKSWRRGQHSDEALSREVARALKGRRDSPGIYKSRDFSA